MCPQLADTVTGLEYLHEHGIVHGDLKGVSGIHAAELVIMLSTDRPIFSLALTVAPCWQTLD